MKSPLRSAALLALGICCVCLWACGGGTSVVSSKSLPAKAVSAPTAKVSAVSQAPSPAGKPSEVVLTIGENKISRGRVEHLMGIGEGHPEVPTGPGFSGCVAHLSASGLGGGDQSQLELQCEKKYAELERPALRALIGSEWAIQEAARRGIGVSDAQVDNLLKSEVSKQFPSYQGFLKYLKTVGETVDDVKFNLRAELAVTNLQRLVKSKVPRVTPVSVEHFYRTHLGEFAISEARDIEAIRTWTKAAVETAKHEVERGRSFAKIAKLVSIDRPSNEHGGVTKGIVPGQEENGFDQAIFAAKAHDLVGPIHLRHRYYIFEVTDIHPARQRSLSEVEPSLRGQLPSLVEKHDLELFIASWRRRWKARTSCRPGFVIEKCRQYSGAPEGQSDLQAFN